MILTYSTCVFLKRTFFLGNSSIIRDSNLLPGFLRPSWQIEFYVSTFSFGTAPGLSRFLQVSLTNLSADDHVCAPCVNIFISATASTERSARRRASHCWILPIAWGESMWDGIHMFTHAHEYTSDGICIFEGSSNVQGPFRLVRVLV